MELVQPLLEWILSVEAVGSFIIAVLAGVVSILLVQIVFTRGLNFTKHYLGSLRTDAFALMNFLGRLALFGLLFWIGAFFSLPQLYYPLTLLILAINIFIEDTISHHQLERAGKDARAIGQEESRREGWEAGKKAGIEESRSRTPTASDIMTLADDTIYALLRLLESLVAQNLNLNYAILFPHAQELWVRCAVFVWNDKTHRLEIKWSVNMERFGDNHVTFEKREGIAGTAFATGECTHGSHWDPQTPGKPRWIFSQDIAKVMPRDLGYIWSCPILDNEGKIIGVLNCDASISPPTESLSKQIENLNLSIAGVISRVLPPVLRLFAATD